MQQNWRAIYRSNEQFHLFGIWRGSCCPSLVFLSFQLINYHFSWCLCCTGTWNRRQYIARLFETKHEYQKLAKQNARTQLPEPTKLMTFYYCDKQRQKKSAKLIGRAREGRQEEISWSRDMRS